MPCSTAEPTDMDRIEHKTMIKALLLLGIAAGSIALVEFSPLREYLTPEQFETIVARAGPMAPALLVISCAIGSCFFVPGTIFVAVGTALYGPLLGFAFILPGVLAAATISFFIARKLGRDFVASFIGGRLRKFDDSIARNGFRTILLLRLAFVPFAAMNFGMGLTKVRFRDYFFATAIGEAATILVVAFFLGALKDAWASGDWGKLLSVKMAMSVVFLVALALIAKVAQKYENKFESDPAESSASDKHVELESMN